MATKRLCVIAAATIAYAVLYAWPAAAQGTRPGGSRRDALLERIAASKAAGNTPKAARPHAAVFRIKNVLDGPICLGTGTLIQSKHAHGVVLTCAHLFDEGIGSLSAVAPNGVEYQAKLLAVDPGNDLAAMLIAKPETTAVPIAGKPPRLGDQLSSCGYGQEGQYAVNRGKVVGFAMREGTSRPNLVEIRGMARHGDSGGPMFNQAGELAGVLIGTDGSVVDGTYSEAIHSFLSKVPQTPPAVELLAKQMSVKPVTAARIYSGDFSVGGIQRNEPMPGKSHRVTGRVIIDKRPVPNAKVQLVGGELRSTTTDADGNFAFDSVPPGQFVVRAEGIAINKIRRASVPLLQPGGPKPMPPLLVKFE